MDVKSSIKKRDEHTTSDNQRDPKRIKKDNHQSAEDETAVANSQGNQHGENNQDLNASPSAPPDADKTLGDSLQDHWFKDDITEQEKEDFKLQLSVSIASLKRFFFNKNQCLLACH